MFKALVLFMVVGFSSHIAHAQITSTVNSACDINIRGEIDANHVSLITALVKRTCNRNWRLKISLASEGGDLAQALSLASFLSGWPGGVSVHGSNVESAAVVVYLAGDYRTIDPTGRIFIHEPRLTIETSHYTQAQLEEMLSNIKSGKKTLIRVISESTNLSPDAVEKMMDKATFIDSETAVKYGMSHQIKLSE